MAPFKLKFRMGGSRSTSQEHDPDPQVNEALLNHHSTAIGASNSTIDSADCNSLGSLGTNERKSLLPSKSNSLRLGYINHSAIAIHGANETATGSHAVPTTPPPLYEHVLEENSRLSSRFELNPKRQLSGEESGQHSQRSSTQNLRNSANLSPLEQLSLVNLTPCTDPDCQENYANNEQRLQRQQEVHNDAAADERECEHDDNDEHEPARTHNESDSSDNRKKSIDSSELFISTNMTAPSLQEHLLDGCTSECPQYGDDDDGACDGACGGVNAGAGGGSRHNNDGDFCDPLLNHNGYCSNESHCGEDCQQHHSQQQLERYGDADGEQGWDSNPHQRHSQQQQQQERSLTPEIISNKSSKEIYKDLAKQWGITCKMSDGCRCMDCQSHYFDCEFDDNEHQKTDGGLGAGTPMFISEVMHGSACQIL